MENFARKDPLLAAATAGYAIWYAVGAMLLLTDLPPPSWKAAAGPWADCVFLALAALLAFALSRRDHGTRLATTASGFVLLCSGTVEILGVNFGLPFGAYFYTDRLGPRLLNMPWIIPCCWMFLMICGQAIASATLARRVRNPDDVWPLSCLAAAAIVTVFDLLLEPVAVDLKLYWGWLDRAGIWYGAPRLNFAGWFVLSLVLSAGISRVLKPARWRLRTAAGAWLLLASTVFLFGGMSWRAGQHAPAWVGLNLVGLTAVALAWAARRPSPAVRR